MVLYRVEVVVGYEELSEDHASLIAGMNFFNRSPAGKPFPTVFSSTSRLCQIPVFVHSQP